VALKAVGSSPITHPSWYTGEKRSALADAGALLFSCMSLAMICASHAIAAELLVRLLDAKKPAACVAAGFWLLVFD
jgi:hypothetical protein